MVQQLIKTHRQGRADRDQSHQVAHIDPLFRVEGAGIESRIDQLMQLADFHPDRIKFRSFSANHFHGPCISWESQENRLPGGNLQWMGNKGCMQADLALPDAKKHQFQCTCLQVNGLGLGEEIGTNQGLVLYFYFSSMEDFLVCL